MHSDMKAPYFNFSINHKTIIMMKHAVIKHEKAIMFQKTSN